MTVTVQAKAQYYLRNHMADESKNEYAAQLQNFNAEQWKHFNNSIPHIFKVTENHICLAQVRDGHNGAGKISAAKMSRLKEMPQIILEVT